jgi:hypothetical protein
LARIFTDDDPEPARHVERCLVLPVLSDASASGRQLGDTAEGLCASGRPALAPRDDAPCAQTGARLWTAPAFATPRSTPTDGQILPGASCAVSQANEICPPSASKETVAFFIVPRIGRVSRNFTQPIFGRRAALHLPLNRFVSTSRPLEPEGVVYALAARPGIAGAPAKKLPNALSRSRSAGCWPVWETAAIQPGQQPGEVASLRHVIEALPGLAAGIAATRRAAAPARGCGRGGTRPRTARETPTAKRRTYCHSLNRGLECNMILWGTFLSPNWRRGEVASRRVAIKRGPKALDVNPRSFVNSMVRYYDHVT